MIEPYSHPSLDRAADLPAQPPAAARVLLAGRLTALDAPGGGEVQMTSLARELPRVGVAARMWRPWEDALEQAEILHLFGSAAEFLPLVAAAQRRGLKVALSPIAWFSLARCWQEPQQALHRRLAACARFLVRAVQPGIPSWRRRLYHAVDLLMPNSKAEAHQLIRYFGLSAERLYVVPNGAAPRFAHGDLTWCQRELGLRDFVLYAGRIEPRKNQLGFLHAMRGSGVPIVIAGDVVPGQERYLAACRRAAGPNVHFLGRLAHDDPRLASLYAACGCLALCSWFETPGLVALEAGMSGVPLVLPAAGCAREYFGDLARYVRPTDRAGIRRAVLAALAQGRDRQRAEHVQQRFSWTAAARVTRDAYQRMLPEGFAP